MGEARRPFWRRWLGVAAFCAGSVLLPVIASAQETYSANWVLPGCRAFLSSADQHVLRQGICAGVVRGIADTHSEVCMPLIATYGQAISVVAHYIDAHPARQHQSFTVLALEALRAVWPCH